MIGAIGQHGDIDRGGQRRLQLRQQLLDPVDDLDDVGAGLALDVDDDRRQLVRPGREAGVFRAVDDVGDIGEPYRRAVAVADDHALVLVGRFELIVGVDGRCARRSVEASLGLIGVGVADRGAHVVQRQSVRGERGWIRLDAHRGRCPPVTLTRPTPGSCDSLVASRVSARSSIFGNGSVFDVSARIMIGVSAGLTLL